ncbi:hypothetical protein ACHAWF_004311, partial [Thalassiosira exigua]
IQLDDNNMGNAASAKEARRAHERAYIRSLGDRYPLGDAELRKWCWCSDKWASSSPPPATAAAAARSAASPTSSLAAWSAVYGDYDPYDPSRSRSRRADDANDDPIGARADAADRVAEAVATVERRIFPRGLSASVVRNALRLSSRTPNGRRSRRSSAATDPLLRSSRTSTSQEEISAFEESFYSIDASVDPSSDASSRSDGLEEFLEGMSASCGRRGSRASLSKLFSLSSTSDEPGRPAKADASKVIHSAYCLTLAATYLKEVAESGPGNTNWEDFVPQSSPEDNVMQPMVRSLLDSAAEHRRGGGGIGGTFGFDRSPSKNEAGGAPVEGDATVSLGEFLKWSETAAPMMASALPTFLRVLLTFFAPVASGEDGRGPRFPPGVSPLWMPSVTVEPKNRGIRSSPASSIFSTPSSSSFDLFALSCASLALASGRWHRLFSSEADGLSCNRLMHSLLGYGGPTVLIIRCKDASDKGLCASGTFGAYTATAWKESPSFYGNSACFLFRLGPDPMAVYRPEGREDAGGMDAFGPGKGASSHQESETRNYMYFNTEARSKGYDGLAHGIGFGGASEMPRLYVDEVLDGCRAAPEDLTYSNGPLLSGLKDSSSSAGSHFEVDQMEAYGVGSPQMVREALDERDGLRRDEQKRIRRAMKGAKGALLEDMQTGLVGNKVFQHRDQMRGRDGACDLDDAGEEE